MASGLENVVAAETILSHTDRTSGMVWVRRRDLPTLARDYGFEGTVALLWNGFAGEGLTRSGIASSFGQARMAAYACLPDWLPQTAGRPLFEAARIALAAQSDRSSAIDLAAAFAVAVPALVRQASGLPPVRPDPGLTTAGDLLRMLHDAPPDPAKTAALDTYFTVMAESGLSASAFAARVVASTRASLAASVLAGWCAFTGPLHGGAPGPTLDMLDAARSRGRPGTMAGSQAALGRAVDGFRPPGVPRQRSAGRGDAPLDAGDGAPCRTPCLRRPTWKRRSRWRSSG